MRIYRQLPTIQSGIATRWRKSWLLAACILALLTFGVSEPALAQQSFSGPFPNGILFQVPSGISTVTLQSDVNVTGNASNNEAVAIQNFNAGPGGSTTTVQMLSGAKITVSEPSTYGLHLLSNAGDAVVTAMGQLMCRAKTHVKTR